ncbi:MAG: type II toxin-antitoxin system ParD family antitoxin [Phycisphaeraceae bacterium]
MPTQNVSLQDHQAEFIRSRIESGRFQNASEVVRAGLRLLEQQEAENELKLKALREAIDVGFADIDAGRYTEINSREELSAFMDSVSAKPKRDEG